MSPKILYGLAVVALLLLAVIAYNTSFKSRPVEPIKWEYSLAEYDPISDKDKKSALDDEMPNIFDGIVEDARKMGSEGWELCGCYTESETVFPKDVVSEAIMGSNVRTGHVVLIFKRPLN